MNNKYKFGTPGRVLNYAAPVYEFLTNLFLLGYDKKTAKNIVSDLEKIFENTIATKKKIRILDIGCGTGAITRLLANNQYIEKIIGIDAAPKMIKLASQRKSNITISFINTVSEYLPFKDNIFDCVINTMFLHHIPLNSKIQTFSEINRVLKKDGIIYTIDFSKSPKQLQNILVKLLALILLQPEITENVEYGIPYFIELSNFEIIENSNYKFNMVSKIIAQKK